MIRDRHVPIINPGPLLGYMFSLGLPKTPEVLYDEVLQSTPGCQLTKIQKKGGAPVTVERDKYTYQERCSCSTQLSAIKTIHKKIHSLLLDLSSSHQRLVAGETKDPYCKIET